jgi:hypothetical protein
VAIAATCCGCSEPFETGGTGGGGAATATTSSGGSGGAATTTTSSSTDSTTTSGSGGSPPEQCVDAQLIDDFSATPLGGEWIVFGDGVSVVNGMLAIEPPAVHQDNGASRGPFRFPGCELRFEVVGVHPLGQEAQTSVALWQDGRNYVQFRLGPSHILGFLAVDNDVSLVNGSVAYDPDVHRWWGFRVSGGQIVFQTSPDGVSWTDQASGQAPVLVSSHNLTFALNVGSATMPGRAAFDNIELLAL